MPDALNGTQVLSKTGRRSMSNSKIQWTNKVWNPVRGCSIVSKGCKNCYAMKQAHRFSGPGLDYEGLTKMTSGGPVWTGDVRLVPEMLDRPLHWRKPLRVFVNSMSDLYHEDVPFEFIDRVFAIMAIASGHTYQILTKRPERMRAYMTEDRIGRVGYVDSLAKRHYRDMGRTIPAFVQLRWPLPNVWLGVSVEDQSTANERIPILMDTPAAIRWISAEPLLNEIDLTLWLHDIDWVVVGGESGPKARGFCLSWLRCIQNDCCEFETPLFIKQFGARPYETDDGAPYDEPGVPKWPVSKEIHLDKRKGDDMGEWPKDYRVQEYPA